MIGKFFTFMVYCKSWNLSQKSKPQVEQLDVILFLTVIHTYKRVFLYEIAYLI